MKNVVLIGFMGCGKSTVGIRLSYRLRRVVEDTDRRIEREQGKSISEIFAEQGEAYFRELETDLLRRMKQEPGIRIIATGGGLPMRKENRRLLHELGQVIYLQLSPETVYERLKNDTSRPLLQGEDPLGKIQKLMSERAPVYEETADIVINVDGNDMEKTLQMIEAALAEREEQA